MGNLTEAEVINEVACTYLMEFGRRAHPAHGVSLLFWLATSRATLAGHPMPSIYDGVILYMRELKIPKIPLRFLDMDMLIPDGSKLQREDVITCLPIPQRAFDAMVDASTRFKLHTDNGVPFVYRRAGDKTAIILCVREGDDPVAEVAWMRMIKGRTELIYIVGASEQALSAPELISRAMGTRRETLVDLTEGEIGDEPR